MATLGDIANGTVTSIYIVPTKERRFTGRRYDIIGYRLNGEIIERKNVSANLANKARKQLRLGGCYRVDKIEIETMIPDKNNERTNLVFSEKSYVPALEGSIPKTVSASDKKIANDRTKMHVNNMLKMMRRNNLVKVGAEKILIYSKNDETKVRANKDKRRVVHIPKLIFSGTESEAIFFLTNNRQWNASNMIIYLPEKIYQEVNR